MAATRRSPEEARRSTGRADWSIWPAGFGCLGMPVNRRAPHLRDGHGAGCEALIDAVRPDAAVIAKSGWAVSWSEVGLAWFTVRVSGIHTYVGSRHLLAYRNAVADAADLILDVESWIEERAEARSDEFNRPQGIVAAVRGGDPSATAFTGCTCAFTVDLRIPPGIDADSAERALAERVDRRAAAAGIDATATRTVAIDGACTDPSEPVVQAAVKSWEAETGRPHQPIRGLSGATDANIPRAGGIPTARVGLAWSTSPATSTRWASLEPISSASRSADGRPDGWPASSPIGSRPFSSSRGTPCWTATSASATYACLSLCTATGTGGHDRQTMGPSVTRPSR